MFGLVNVWFLSICWFFLIISLLLVLMCCFKDIISLFGSGSFVIVCVVDCSFWFGGWMFLGIDYILFCLIWFINFFICVFNLFEL